MCPKLFLPKEEKYKELFQEFVAAMVHELALNTEELGKVDVSIERTLSFAVKPCTDFLELIRRLILGIVANVQLADSTRQDISLAVDEACTNIINHSYNQAQEGMIEVSVTLSRYFVMIIITDTGEKGQTFDPEKVKPFDRDKYLQRLERGGLGVYIIKTIMDEVEYHIQPGAYNKLKMIKYIRDNSAEKTKKSTS